MLLQFGDVKVLLEINVLSRVASFGATLPKCPYRAVFNRQFSQGKPWAKFSWPFGPKTDSTWIKFQLQTPR
jgi:hypothetical protein